MGCPITFSRIAKDCKGVGGIKRIALFDRTKVDLTDSSFGFLSGGTCENITLIGGYKGEEIENIVATNSFNTVMQKSLENGSVFYETDIVVQVFKMTPSKQVKLASLALGELVLWLEDNNGNVWVFGIDNPAEMLNMEAVTGTALGDKNGYQLTFKAWDKNPAPSFDFTVAGESFDFYITPVTT